MTDATAAENTDNQAMEQTRDLSGARDMIACEGVSKWYGSVVAVNDVSLDVYPGITGLLGPNGAGKTTLLHLIAGLARPSDGDVSVLDQPVRNNPG
ncbi:MAG TPA: ATP-binding cassette domain-containing protein, partial [Acidimicrobiales bacterium]|nr:ATP-binding cassette domain-containing protein [Acidimicrobiales bacterium]